ncbi:MAG: energy-converting hydrogenase B subunit EhbP [Theionarchaea archaeon]|nr:energy-converting hydrogenase B subunit EhbP [Theionarchaea archaeon]
MCKFILPSKKVQNMGGYIVENHSEFPFRDLIVGNPTDENIKIPVPIYTMDEVEKIKELGIVTYEMQAGESLAEALQTVKDKIGKEPKRTNYW